MSNYKTDTAECIIERCEKTGKSIDDDNHWPGTCGALQFAVKQLVHERDSLKARIENQED